MSSIPRERPSPLSGFHGLTGHSLKKLVSWDDNLKVDQPQIDAQHQAIFDIALEIADIWHQHGDLDKLKAVTDKLGRVLESHFRFEEAQLADLGYSKLAEHSAEHKVMLDELRRIRARLEATEHGTIRSEPGFLVLSYVLGVTVGHITHSDMDYAELARKPSASDG